MINEALQVLIPGFRPGIDAKTRDDGQGPYIVPGSWRLQTRQPSPEEIAAAVPEALQRLARGPVPASITRRQCALEMEARGFVTLDEAEAMTADGTPPAVVVAMLDDQPQETRQRVRLDFRAADYRRTAPVLVQIMTRLGLDDAGTDDFFRSAAAR